MVRGVPGVVAWIRLRGALRPPADKSISHRAALFGAMCDTPVSITNYLYAEDTLSTLDALRARGWTNVTELDMDRDVARRLSDLKPDVVFNALHGTPGEDGTVQGMMDLMGLKYTHSGLETSVIAIDKELTKMVLVPAGIRMPAGKVIDSESVYREDPLSATVSPLSVDGLIVAASATLLADSRAGRRLPSNSISKAAPSS